MICGRIKADLEVIQSSGARSPVPETEHVTEVERSGIRDRDQFTWKRWQPALKKLRRELPARLSVGTVDLKWKGRKDNQKETWQIENWLFGSVNLCLLLAPFCSPAPLFHNSVPTFSTPSNRRSMFSPLSQSFHLLDLLLLCLLLRSLQLLHDEVREVSTLGQKFCIAPSLGYLQGKYIQLPFYYKFA